MSPEACGGLPLAFWVAWFQFCFGWHPVRCFVGIVRLCCTLGLPRGFKDPTLLGCSVVSRLGLAALLDCVVGFVFLAGSVRRFWNSVDMFYNILILYFWDQSKTLARTLNNAYSISFITSYTLHKKTLVFV